MLKNTAARALLYSLTAFLLALPAAGNADEFKLDNRSYQDGPFTKFSGWIPRQLHDESPRFVEDFYELFTLPMLYGEDKLRRNIGLLKIALKRRFRHPREALCRVTTEEEYHKYRLLVTMQIHLVIMRAYMRLGSLYDKRHLYFYNLDFADDLERSFQTADAYYKKALPWWQKAVDYARQAARYPFTIDLPRLESHAFQIVKGELDFGYYIKRHLARLDRKRETTRAFLDTEGRPRPVKKWMSEADDPELEQKLERLYKAGLEQMKERPQFSNP